MMNILKIYKKKQYVSIVNNNWHQQMCNQNQNKDQFQD